MDMRLPRRFHDLFIARIESAVAHVLQNVRVEKRGVLGNAADRAAERTQLQVAHVLSVDEDASGGGLVEAEE